MISSRQLEVSHPTGKIEKVNVCDVHKILPSDHIIISISDKQDFGGRGKYINGPCILEEVMVIDAFLQKISQILESDISKLI